MSQLLRIYLYNTYDTYNSTMNLEPHIARVCKIAYMNHCNICKIHSVLPDHSAAQLIHALILSRIDYCNSILHGILFRFCDF